MAGQWAVGYPVNTAFKFVIEESFKGAKRQNVKLHYKGFIWNQGENDTDSLSHASAYLSNLTSFMSNIDSFMQTMVTKYNMPSFTSLLQRY